MIQKGGKGTNVSLLPAPQKGKKKGGGGGQSNKALEVSDFFSFVYSSGAVNFDLKL